MYRISALAAVAAALLLSACGGSSKPQAASQSGSPRGPHNAHAAYAFSACMRSHGVTNFPDPQVLRKGDSVNVAIAITPAIASSPAFKSAQKTCGHLLPFGQGPSPAQQKAQADAMLAFAQCMRRHGFARFPDPSSQGQLSLQAIQAAGINLKEPAVRPAADACTSVTHGVITKADVAQAIANPNAGSGSQSSAAGG